MNKFGSTGLKTGVKTLAAIFLFASVACSHKAHKDDAASAPASTPAPVAEKSVAETQSVSKDAAAKSSSTSVTCSHGADSRELTVESKGPGCNTNYTKNGKTSSVATGTSGVDHCQKVVDKIRSKLESSGYTCK